MSDNQLDPRVSLLLDSRDKLYAIASDTDSKAAALPPEYSDRSRSLICEADGMRWAAYWLSQWAEELEESINGKPVGCQFLERQASINGGNRQ